MHFNKINSKCNFFDGITGAKTLKVKKKVVIDIYGIIIEFYLIAIGVGSLGCILFALYAKLDPAYYCLQDLIPMYIQEQLWAGVLLIRFVIFAPVVFEIARCVSLNVLVLYSTYMSMTIAFEHLKNLYGKHKNILTRSFSTKLYNRIRILKINLEPHVGCLGFLLYYASLVFGIVSCFAAVKMYDILPIPMFLLFAVFAIIILVLAHIILVPLMELEKSSQNLLRSWKAEIICFRRRNRGFEQQLKSLPVLKWQLHLMRFNVVSCSKYCVAQYCSTYLYYSATSMLSIRVR